MATSTFNTPLNKGIRIRSTAPISCYFEATGDNSEIYTLKGRNALGTDFLVPMQNHYSNHPLFTAASSIEIVATEDDTQIEIKPRAALLGGYSANSIVFFTLQGGQTYRIRANSMSANGHLHNTIIHSTKPISVNSTDDLVMPVVTAGDLVGDQIVPINHIGRKYIALNVFQSLDYSYNPNLYASYVYIYPTEDNTIVSLNGTQLPPLMKGNSFGIRLVTTATRIEANYPIVVYQTSNYINEAGGTMLPHIECTGSHRVVHKVPADIIQNPYITIVVPTEYISDFTLNGQIFPANNFHTVSIVFILFPDRQTVSYPLKTPQGDSK